MRYRMIWAIAGLERQSRGPLAATPGLRHRIGEKRERATYAGFSASSASGTNVSDSVPSSTSIKPNASHRGSFLGAFLDPKSASARDEGLGGQRIWWISRNCRLNPS